MKFRRVIDGTHQTIEVLQAGTWTPTTPADDRGDGLLAVLQACKMTVGAEPSNTTGTLPFQPRSYRDFMLFQQHYEQAGRGYVRRFHPRLAPVTHLFETVTGKTFPRFRPPKLWFQQPIFYMGNHLRFIADGAEIPWPSYTDALDYELELGFVLARPLYNSTPGEATAAIGGFVVFNDISARDVQVAEMASGFGPQKAKHFCNAMSSVVVTADEILPVIDDLRGRVVINGATVADCRSRNMMFTLGEALAHASRDERLEPGEFFATGTWPNGTALENGHWLSPGDTIRLEIDGLGALTNVVGRRGAWGSS